MNLFCERKAAGFGPGHRFSSFGSRSPIGHRQLSFNPKLSDLADSEKANLLPIPVVQPYRQLDSEIVADTCKDHRLDCFAFWPFLALCMTLCCIMLSWCYGLYLLCLGNNAVWPKELFVCTVKFSVEVVRDVFAGKAYGNLKVLIRTLRIDPHKRQPLGGSIHYELGILALVMLFVLTPILAVVFWLNGRLTDYLARRRKPVIVKVEKDVEKGGVGDAIVTGSNQAERLDVKKKKV